MSGDVDSPARRSTEPDAQHQLARAERLGDVVVGAQLETDHAVLLRAERGQHDDREVAAGTDAAEHLETIDAGQHHIEHDEVGPLVSHHRQRGLAVGRLRDVVPLGAQVGQHHLADGRVVVDDEHVRHQGVPLWSSAGWVRLPRYDVRRPALPPLAGSASSPPRHRPARARPARASPPSSSAASARDWSPRCRSCRGPESRSTSSRRAPRTRSRAAAAPTSGATRTRSTPSTTTSGARTASCRTLPTTSHSRVGSSRDQSKPSRSRTPTSASTIPAAPSSVRNTSRPFPPEAGPDTRGRRHVSTSIRDSHLVWRTPGRFGAISRHG